MFFPWVQTCSQWSLHYDLILLLVLVEGGTWLWKPYNIHMSPLTDKEMVSKEIKGLA